MRKMIRFELSRAFTTIGFKLSILVGIIIAVSHFFISVLPYALKLDAITAMERPMMTPGQLYFIWLGGNSNSVQSFLFFMILPLLAALPFADSFYSDATEGYIAEISTRTNLSHYLIGKYIAVFLSGGVAVIFPLLLNFFMCSQVFPALKPESAYNGSLIDAATSLGRMFYSRPLLFLFIHFLMVFFAAGFFAVFSLSASYYCSYQFLALISPFLLYISLVAIFGLFGLENWQPNNILDPAYYGEMIIPFFVMCISLAILSLFFFFKGKRADIF